MKDKKIIMTREVLDPIEPKELDKEFVVALDDLDVKITEQLGIPVINCSGNKNTIKETK